jgi:hypothetical protein
VEEYAVQNGIIFVMNFKELVLHLESCIGYHQIPINPTATGTKDLFESCALHHELMTDLMRAIYVENGCCKLTDPVNRRRTHDAVAPIRLQVLRSAKTDVDKFDLIENFCTAIEQAFTADDRQPHITSARQPTKEPGRTAQVIPLAKFRYRRFTRLA